MFEDSIKLNVQELGVILTALQSLDNADQHRISREYGSVPALYNRLYTTWEKMDRSQVGIRYDVVPSY